MVTAYALCRNGVGIAIYPAAAADIVKDRDSVRIRTISDPGIRASYVLIYSSEHPLHTLARRFVDHILSQTAKGRKTDAQSVFPADPNGVQIQFVEQ